MVYELTHGTQRFLLFPRLRIMHAIVDGELRNVTTMSEESMITLLNSYHWVRR